MSDFPQIQHFGRGIVFQRQAIPLFVQHCVGHTYERLHDHDFVEIALVLGGTAVHRTLSGAQELSAGDGFVIRPGTWHGYEQCRSLELYNCCFGQELLQRELAWTLQDPFLSTLFWREEAAQAAGMIRLSLSNESRRRSVIYLDKLADIVGAGWTLRKCQAQRRGAEVAWLLLLLDELATGVRADEREDRRPNRPPPPFVTHAIRLLDVQPEHAWTMEELSSRLRVDASHLGRNFKAVTGLPPTLYLARRRAESAAELLLRTDLPIYEIASRVGWANVVYFARRFKSHFGISASEYRRRHAKQAKESASDMPPAEAPAAQ